MAHSVTPGQSRLARIITGAVREPDRVLVHGVEKVGKSTFASNAPSPIFITAEEGAAQIGVTRITPLDYKDLVAILKELAEAPGDFKTVVIDTLDSLEPMVWANVAARNGKQNIEDLGYGKGYTMAEDEWNELFTLLDRLRKTHGMEVILLAHSVPKNFQNPMGPDYSRYEPTLHKIAANLVKGWADTILFATFEGGAVDASGKIVTDLAAKGKVKGIETGRRIVKTQRSAAWDAGNRYNLPPELDLSYQAYAAGREAFWKAKQNYVDPAPVYAACKALVEELWESAPKEKLDKASEYVEKHKGDGAALKQALAKLEEMKKEKN